MTDKTYLWLQVASRALARQISRPPQAGCKFLGATISIKEQTARVRWLVPSPAVFIDIHFTKE